MTKRPAAIFDLDGTLASCDWRRHFVTISPEQRFKDWASFNAGIPFDPVVPWVRDMTRRVHRIGWAVLLTSGRKDSQRQATRDWLAKHEVPFDFLFMRSSKDDREDSVVKEELFRLFIEPDFDVRIVYDDRPQVCDMWERIGLNLCRVEDPCLPVALGSTS